jgi:hypothetical protein
MAVKLNAIPKHSLMKRCLAALLLSAVLSCNTKESGQDVSTVDSNVAGSPDSVPGNLYLDSFGKDTSVRVAMDSAGPTISPQDTSYSNKK